MRIFMNGREVEILNTHEGNVSAKALHEAANIDDGRQLVQLKKNAENVVVNPDDDILISPEDYFIDMPINRRGY